VRTNRTTGCPTASHILRIWRLRPSWITNFNTPSCSLLTSAGDVTPSSSSILKECCGFERAPPHPPSICMPALCEKIRFCAVSKYSTTPTIETQTQPVAFSKISGTTSLDVPTGTTFNECEYITLAFESLSGTTITGKTNSLIYKVLSISGNTLTLDRNVPNLSQISGLTGNAQVICNKFSNETSSGNLIYPIDYTQQLNSWRLNTVWTDKPMGADYPTNDLDESLSGYTSNRYASIKNLLGYTTSGQTFNNFTGGTITGTSFANSFSTGSTHELIDVSPSEQRCIAILHYSELGDISVDPERFFKYDDYISHCTPSGVNACNISIVTNEDGDDISDTEYFEVYIPFIYYHRNTGTTFGALFTMDTTDYYVKSSINSRHQLKFRYLLDEQGYKVGKVFVNNKVIVFDLDETIGSFNELTLLWIYLEKMKSLFNLFLDLNQDYFNKLLDLYPEFIRYGMLTIFEFLNHKKKTKECHKIFIYTNNIYLKEFPEKIKNYIDYKLMRSIMMMMMMLARNIVEQVDVIHNKYYYYIL
jgi:hypothetical protein